MWSQVGRRRPVGTTALGRAVLARMDLVPAALTWYAGDDLTVERLVQVLQATRDRGEAEEFEEDEPGIACFAVPLLRAGAPIAAVSVTVPTERLTPERQAAIIEGLGHRLPSLLPMGPTID